MATTRKRIKRKSAYRVGARAVALYKTGIIARKHVDSCERKYEPSGRPVTCPHPDHETYMEAWSELGDILGIMPHEPSPLSSIEEIRDDRYPERIIPMKQALDAALGLNK